MNDNRAKETADQIIERGMRDLRNDTFAAAIELCQSVAAIGGSAADCVDAIGRLRDALNEPKT